MQFLALGQLARINLPRTHGVRLSDFVEFGLAHVNKLEKRIKARWLLAVVFLNELDRGLAIQGAGADVVGRKLGRAAKPPPDKPPGIPPPP